MEPIGIRPPHAARRGALLLGSLLALAAAAPAASQPTGLGQDSVLAGLLNRALASRPELAQAEASARAAHARVSQVRALPDPVVSVGLQNDGFGRLRIGEMSTSFWSYSAAQTIPVPGKRGLRARAQGLGARQEDTDLERMRLSVHAEVERSYLDLLLARDRLRILDRLEMLWRQAEDLARARYEAGEGAQSDLLRAQLERSRLRQQRWALEAEERRRLAVLNRATGRAFDEPLATSRSLEQVEDPQWPDSSLAVQEAETRTPELRRAVLATEQSGTLLSLARRDLLPDLTVSGGVMRRGAAFEPMWQAGLSVPLPLWAGGKQLQAVGEQRLRVSAAENAAETLRRLVRQRLYERRVMHEAMRETNRLYRSGVLIQSEAATSSAMAQFQVGRVPFTAVLEALGGYLADLTGYLESVAALQRLDIAQRELSLETVPGPPMGGTGGASMSGSGGMNAAPMPSGGSMPSPAAPGAAAPTSAMPRM